MPATPQHLRDNIAFALNLADSLAVTVQCLTADEWGNVTLYAWDVPAATVDEIADREGWTGDTRDGEGWHSRRHTFDVAGRPVFIDLTGDAKPAEVQS